MNFANCDLDNNDDLMKIMGFCQLGHRFENEEDEGKRKNFLRDFFFDKMRSESQNFPRFELFILREKIL